MQQIDITPEEARAYAEACGLKSSSSGSLNHYGLIHIKRENGAYTLTDIGQVHLLRMLVEKDLITYRDDCEPNGDSNGWFWSLEGVPMPDGDAELFRRFCSDAVRAIGESQ